MTQNTWDEKTPWFDEENFIETIIEKTNIIDIFNKFKIEYNIIQSGNFSHKLRCPLPDHLGGEERTPSMFVSEKENKFKCFGCNAHGNIIDFVKLYLGVPFYEAVKFLSNLYEITEDDICDIKIKERKIPEKTIIYYTHRVGILMRDFLNSMKNNTEYFKYKDWSDKIFLKLDLINDKLNDNDWEKAKNFYNKVELTLKKKGFIK